MAQNNIILKKETTDSKLSELKLERNVQKKVKNENRVILIAAIVLFVLYFSSISFLELRPGSHTIANLITIARNNFEGFLNYIGGNKITYSSVTIVKYTTIVLAGASLAVAGVVFQGSFKNIVASPSTMGVQSGAALGNALYLLLFTKSASGFILVRQSTDEISGYTFYDFNLRQICVIAMAFITLAIVIVVMKILGRGKFTTANILFSGMIISSFFEAIESIIQYYFLYFDVDNGRLQILRSFSLGSFNDVTTMEQLLFISAIIVPCLIVIVVISPKLNALVMSEDEAKTMGVNVRLLRILIIGTGTLMAATVFAFCGKIGFLGFIAPQIARRFVGPDFKRLSIMSMLIGAITLILVYSFAAIFYIDTYINMVTSIIGCSMMAYSLFKGKGGNVVYE